MYVCRRPTKFKNHYSRLFFNQLWLTVAIVVVISCGKEMMARADSTETGGVGIVRSNRTLCATRKSCSECTADTAAACSWSLVKQSCNETAATTTGMTSWTVDDPLMRVYDVGSCPVLSISYNKGTDIGALYHVVRVNVTNDPTGAFGIMLARGAITCQLNEMKFSGTLEPGGTQIACKTVENKNPNRSTPSSVVLYFSAAVNGVPLQFDNRSDHYVTVYHGSCHTDQPRDKDCARCYWDDDVYRYYCQWCNRNNLCTGLYEHCDIRRLADYSYTRDVKDVHVRCPTVRIESIEPVYGPWAGGTTMRIGVANHKLLAENKVIVVTVAGTRCLLPTASVDGKTITCTITPLNSSRLNEGPVEVMYKSDHDKSVTSFTLRSEQTFYFVDPEITDIRPKCGPAAGGTKLNIRGNFLNAGNSLRVYIRENISCEITVHGQNDVTCVTGASGAPTAGKVKLEFDNYLSKYVNSPLFQYTGDPTVDGNQTFLGIASGGTRLPVHGRYFACIENPLIYVSYNGFRHTGACRVQNDTYMECVTPKINRPAPRSVVELPFGFQADYDRTILPLQPPPGSSDYLLHPDPVYTDFETDGGRTVTINGLHLDRGYHLADDLSVRLQDSGVPCNVTFVGPRTVVCQTPLQPSADGVLSPVVVNDGIVVVVGNNLVYEVKRKPVHLQRSPMRFMTIFLIGVTLVSLIITIVVAVVYCMKIAMLGGGQQTEMQSLCERQTQSPVTLAMAISKDVEEDKTC